jgi:hypothetical protein
MKLSCDKATAICDKSQYGEINIRDRIKLGLHLLLCRKCGLYSKQNSVLSTCYKKHQGFEKKNQCSLTDGEKECMDEKIKEKSLF